MDLQTYLHNETQLLKCERNRQMRFKNIFMDQVRLFKSKIEMNKEIDYSLPIVAITDKRQKE